MNQPKTSMWRRIYALCAPYWFANDKQAVPLPFVGSINMPAKWVGRIFLMLLLAGLVSINMLNVKLNFAWGDILNYLQDFAANSATDPAKAEAAKASFFTAIYSIGMVFLYGTFIVVAYRWVRAKLAISWRTWMTDHFVTRYLNKDGAHYRIGNLKHIDNPDERIHQDIDAVVNQTLSLALTFIDSIVTLISFGAVLWAISQNLTYIVIGYSLIGSVIILLFGRRLVSLNFMQLKLEADFRYGLIHVRNHTEAIRFYRGEEHEQRAVKGRFGQVVTNYHKLINWTANVGFFQTAFDYFVTIIPYLIIAPLFFAGEAKLGTFQQASMAFGQILGALAVVVSSFQSLAQYAANVDRLGGFDEALKEKPNAQGKPTIKTVVEPRIAMQDMTLQTPDYARTLIERLNLEIKEGTGVIVMGRSGVGKSSLLRGLAGLWDSGNGTIIHPELGEMMFLPQTPYMLLGTLREQFTYPNAKATDEEIHQMAVLVGLPEDFISLRGGLDAEAKGLSLGEQQRVAFARLLLARPRYAILDEATSALDIPLEQRLYSLLRNSGVTFISVGHRPSVIKYHDAVLELTGEGGWRIVPTADFIVEVKAARERDEQEPR